MSQRLYQLFCDRCTYKLITNGNNINLVEYKTAAVQATIPDLDSETGLRKEIKFKNLTRRFKCPKCGYIIKPKIIDDPNAKIEEENKLKERIVRRAAYEKEQERIEQEKREKENENRANGNKTGTK